MELSETARKIINLMMANNAIPIATLEREFSLSKEGVKYHLAILKRAGILKRIGGSRGGSWLIKGDNLQNDK